MPGDPFGPGGGPGGRRPNALGVEVDPLAGADDPTKPLLSRLLAVPSLRERYLDRVRAIAEEWLDWKKLGPMVERYRTLIDEEVAADTRKLYSYDAFASGCDGDTAGEAEAAPAGRRGEPRPFGPFGGRRQVSIKAFAEARRAYPLAHPEIAKLPR